MVRTTTEFRILYTRRRTVRAGRGLERAYAPKRKIASTMWLDRLLLRAKSARNTPRRSLNVTCPLNHDHASQRFRPFTQDARSACVTPATPSRAVGRARPLRMNG